ncbi:MAG: DEAD/DEAH box helicase [Acidimicrobiales bacterium]|nr:DEAD/DEAH box helicase [Acidimicrobiales bacterium]
MALLPSSDVDLANATAVADVLCRLAAARDEELRHGDERSGALAPASLEEGRLAHLVHLPARPARHAELERPLPPAVAAAVPRALWTHQVEALGLLRAGRSVVVATGTGSGKSLCYQLAMAEAASAPVRPGTGLVLFPTKALAHDQLRALADLGLPRVVPGAYDGDASPEERTWIRKHANVVLTNPEMLHSGLLPHHARWATFLGRLRYVVIDELHTFRGVFGSHVAQLVRRLRRLAAHYGADPTFICCSATVGAPERLASAVTGVDVVPVLDDGSPQGPRTIALWRPPLLDQATGARASAHRESAAIVAGLIDAGHATLGFTRSRRTAETVAADVRRRLPRALARRVRAYRGGYLAEERREIEDELFAGRLRGVVATSALELGIDVGCLDAVVLDGFPGTIASFWQQVGRAGRSGAASAGVLVAGADQLDQWLVAHPDELLTRRPEPAIVNPDNPHVVDPHLRCAAHELPLTHADARWWPGSLDDGVRRLALTDELLVRHRGRRNEPMAVWNGAGWPSHGVGLRTAAGRPVRIVDGVTGTQVGDVDRARAPEQVHPGASYLHQGLHWRVVDLDLDAGVATVERDEGLTYTVPRTETSIRLLHVDRQRTVGRATLCVGAVEVASRVVGYQRKETFGGSLVATEALDLPTSTLVTRAFWYLVCPERAAAAGVDRVELPSALHAVEHAAIGMLPLFAICDRWDVGGLSIACHPDTALPTIVIYDAMPGGAGVAELGYEAADRHLAATLASVKACGCESGCPSCVQSPKCGNGNDHLDKAGAIRLLHDVLAD